MTTALTAEEAAKLTGYTTAWFRTAMSKLNKAGHDLRTPKQPGERARRYDLDKVTAWIEDGKKIPNGKKADENATVIVATAEHVNGLWRATLASGEVATGKTLRVLQDNADALVSGTGEGEVFRVQLEVNAPGQTAERWAAAAQKQEDGNKLIAQASEERQNLIAQLRATGGFIQEDIATMLGISQQRVTQHLQGKAKA